MPSVPAVPCCGGYTHAATSGGAARSAMSMSTSALRVVWTLLLAATALSAADASPPEPKKVRFAETADLLKHRGFVADNGLASVGIGADAGARVLRFDLAGKPLLWNDPSAVGNTGQPLDGTSVWYYRETGGWRVWPGPQAQWKRRDAPIPMWPPPPTIDHGVYKFFPGDGTVDAHGPAEANPLWRCAGMQCTYSFRLDPAAARLRVSARMTNLAPYPQRWAQWMVTAAAFTKRADPAQADTVSWPFRAAAPSRFGARGYFAHAGDYDDPKWQPDAAARLVRARCLGGGGKIGGDSDGGWIALQDGADGTVLALRFPPPGDLEPRVPEGWSSVTVNMMDHAVELEAMTPEYDLDPGASSLIDWQLCACRIAAPLTAVVAAGVVAAPLRVERGAADARVTGSFGTFARGRAVLRAGAQELAAWPCSPTSPLAIDQRLAIPAGAELTLVVLPEQGEPELLATLAAP